MHAWPDVEVRVITGKENAKIEGSRAPRLIEVGVPIRWCNSLYAAVRAALEAVAAGMMLRFAFVLLGCEQFCIVDGNTVLRGEIW